MKIILFRHGEKQKIDSTSVSDKNGVGLTDLGIIQINKLAIFLAKNFSSLNSSQVIYSSPYKRALQSAEIIKTNLNIKEIIIAPEFGEFIAYNNYSNPKEIRQRLQIHAMQDPNWVSPETNQSLNNSISSFKNRLIEICSRNLSDYVLVASHGAIIRSFIYSFDSKYSPNNDLILDAKINEAGCTILDYTNGKFTVEKFNIHHYLD